MELLQPLSAEDVKKSDQYQACKAQYKHGLFVCILAVSLALAVSVSLAIGMVVSLLVIIWIAAAVVLAVLIPRVRRYRNRMKDLTAYCAEYICYEAQPVAVSANVKTGFRRFGDLYYRKATESIGFGRWKTFVLFVNSKFVLKTAKGKKVTFYKVYKKSESPTLNLARKLNPETNGTEFFDGEVPDQTEAILVGYREISYSILTFSTGRKPYDVVQEDQAYYTE